MDATTDFPAVSTGSVTARAIMSSAGETVCPGASLWEVVERFLAGSARHVLVVDDDNRCLGVVCSRHLAGLWPLDGELLKRTPVESVGLARWVSLRPDDDLRTCARTLTEYELDAVPVLDDDSRVIGVVTLHGLARALADAPACLVS